MSIFKYFTQSQTQIIKYALVSIISLSVDIFILKFLTDYLSIWYIASSCAAFICGLITSYCLSMNWNIFNKSGNSQRDFLLFSIVGLSGLLLNNTGMFVLTDVVGLYYIYSKLITTVCVFFFNYFGRKYALSKYT